MLNWFNNRYQKKQLQTTTLFKIFEFISNDEERQYRHFIYGEWKRSEGKPDFNREVLYDNRSVRLQNIVNNVEANFDKVCALQTTGLVDKKMLFDLYGIMIVKSYIAMKNDIIEKQKMNRQSLIHFSEIAMEFEPKLTNEEKTIY
jgi:hypothetical protein